MNVIPNSYLEIEQIRTSATSKMRYGACIGMCKGIGKVLLSDNQEKNTNYGRFI